MLLYQRYVMCTTSDDVSLILQWKTSCLNRIFFGSKNDAQRMGFGVILPKSNVVKIDPVQTLYDYIERTREHKGQDGPVFISLRSPYNAVGKRVLIIFP